MLDGCEHRVTHNAPAVAVVGLLHRAPVTLISGAGELRRHGSKRRSPNEAVANQVKAVQGWHAR